MDDIYWHEAEDYEKRWDTYLAHTHRKFLGLIETEQNDVLLDLSGGTGLLAQELLEEKFPFSKLVINDPSPRMMEIAQNRLPEDNRLEYSHHRAEEIEKDVLFDRIFCLNAFHNYEKQQRVLGAISDHLNPAGRFYLLDWNREGYFRIINKIIDWSTSEVINTRSILECKKLLLDSGFEIKRSDRWHWRYWKFQFIEAQKTTSD